MQTRTVPRYTLSASGHLLGPEKTVATQQVSQSPCPGALTLCEISGLIASGSSCAVAGIERAGTNHPATAIIKIHLTRGRDRGGYMRAILLRPDRNPTR